MASRYKNVDKLKFKLSMIKVDDFLFPFKIYLYILIGVIFILRECEKKSVKNNPSMIEYK